MKTLYVPISNKIYQFSFSERVLVWNAKTIYYKYKNYFFIIDLMASGRDQVPPLLQIWARGTVLHGGHKWIEILSEGAFLISRLRLLKTGAR